MAYWTDLSILANSRPEDPAGVASRCGNSPGRTMPENEQSCVNVELLRMNKVGFPLFSRLIMPRCQIFASVGAKHMAQLIYGDLSCCSSVPHTHLSSYLSPRPHTMVTFGGMWCLLVSISPAPPSGWTTHPRRPGLITHLCGDWRGSSLRQATP